MTAPQESNESHTPESHASAQQDVEGQVPVQATPPLDLATDPHGASSLRGDDVELKHQLAWAQQRIEALQEALQRERADFLNYRRRVTQERDDLRQRARADVFRMLLPVLDDLERALQQTSTDRTSAPWVEGFRIVARKFLTLLEQAGIARIGATGEPFDPRFHEAVTQRLAAHPDEKAGTIGEVIHPGYRLGDQVLRPAQVIVVSDAPPSGRNNGVAPAR